ncbi:hypothetical protein ABZ934_32035 [Streptomyces sp. NPDC046557]|uniref:hypothetical protein n=1 Tax=Streptomyces sp. NPDC046557 TaxID=3155372 RepID=UPI0033C2FB87
MWRLERNAAAGGVAPVRLQMTYSTRAGASPNVPAGRSFTARVAPAVGDPMPTGLIAWNLHT